MARQKKRPTLEHCRVSRIAHPKTPWRVSWPIERDGKTVRTFKRLADEDAAWAFAEETNREISNHGVRFGELPPEARRAFDYYRDQRAAMESGGATVPTFERLVSDALAAILAAHAAREENALAVAEAVEAFVAYKRGRVSTRQLDNLRLHLKRFAQDFGVRPMRSVTTAQIESWLANLRSRKNPGKLPVPPAIGAIARNAYRASLSAFFNHGSHASRQWCPTNPIAAVAAEKITRAEPRAYTPEAVQKIMRAAIAIDSPLLPALTLEMFAGLRPAEAMAIDLAAIDFGEDDFRVPASHRNGEPTKTGARIAPFLPAAKAFLATQPRRTGPAYPGDRNGHSREMRRILEAAEVAGIHDGPRHSFISYRAASTRVVAVVADEVGNSPQIIRKNYRKIVTAAAAERFFAIRPEASAENVTDIQEGRVA